MVLFQQLQTASFDYTYDFKSSNEIKCCQHFISSETDYTKRIACIIFNDVFLNYIRQIFNYSQNEDVL